MSKKQGEGQCDQERQGLKRHKGSGNSRLHGGHKGSKGLLEQGEMTKLRVERKKTFCCLAKATAQG